MDHGRDGRAPGWFCSVESPVPSGRCEVRFALWWARIFGFLVVANPADAAAAAIMRVAGDVRRIVDEAVQSRDGTYVVKLDSAAIVELEPEA